VSLKSKKKQLNKIGFGDFQTPKLLTDAVCAFLKRIYKLNPAILLEPTCGTGHFIYSSLYHFIKIKKIIGIDIKDDYLKKADKLINPLLNSDQQVTLLNGNAFCVNFKDVVNTDNNKSLMIIGNLPWITNSGLSLINHSNQPEKTNFLKLRGFDAKTGKSNFDISEYIYLRLIEDFYNTNTIISLIIKKSAARKLLKNIWERHLSYNRCSLVNIDTKKHFKVASDGCLLTIRFSLDKARKFKTCDIYDSLSSKKIKTKLSYFNKIISYNLPFHKKNNQFIKKSDYIWRSGIKHDLAKVLELHFKDNHYYNGFDKVIDIEDNLIFPLYKSSDLMKEKIPKKPRKHIIIPQKFISENTEYIRYEYPKTWDYLSCYLSLFEKRKSIVHKNKPKFSIFSVGEYSFSKYKIAVSAFSKKVIFHSLTSIENKPVMLDDTCNFISLKSRAEMDYIYEMINSKKSISVLDSIIFTDSKRPITIEILNNISIEEIAKYYHQLEKYHNYLKQNKFYMSQRKQ
jgi:hypothetical protein